MEAPVILYDGVCGFCNRYVRFVLERDGGLFRFAALQSELARRLLAAHGVNAGDLDTFYVVFDRGLPSERLLSRAKGGLFVLGRLGAGWRILSLLSLLPAVLLDPFYTLVARNRYRLFGKYDACPLPDPKWRGRFLDSLS